jgi:hypothetical protein
MNFNKAFPSRYLKSFDLQGQRVTVAISQVALEDIGHDKGKMVVYFHGKAKGLVLNRTNARTIANIVGTEETDQWLNHEIILYPTAVPFQGGLVDSIRIDAPPGAKPISPPSDGPISF